MMHGKSNIKCFLFYLFKVRTILDPMYCCVRHIKLQYPHGAVVSGVADIQSARRQDICFYGSRKINTVVTKVRHWSLSYATWQQSIHLPTHMTSKRTLPSGFAIICYAFQASPSLTTCPTHRSIRKSKYLLKQAESTRRAQYVLRNTEARSHNHCCRGKANSIKYSHGVILALFIP
jgi:hypothetical protein